MTTPATPSHGYTDAEGRKTADAPANWPFGTITPPSKAQMLRDTLEQCEAAPF